MDKNKTVKNIATSAMQNVLILIPTIMLSLFSACGGEVPDGELVSDKINSEVPASAQTEDMTTSETPSSPADMSEVTCSHFAGRCTGAFCAFSGESCAKGKTTVYCLKGCWLWAWLDECTDGTIRTGSGTCVW